MLKFAESIKNCQDDENMNNYILILGRKHLGINNSLAPTRHRIKKSLDEGEIDLLTFFLKLGELFIGIPWKNAAGSRTVHTRFRLAPLAGVSSGVFSALARRLPSVSFCLPHCTL
ncbi:hypothetical protein AVEN_82330-1 [Araneus ventricosus]|uniref:Uncharacterized protein n=1 Tax=Araneus ventricosus TaxID=182803 RepID=A0A4Y2IWJ0_ARAVE|nr:hypothetical protein AVEN_82330-1 [Araneus ventricosus]